VLAIVLRWIDRRMHAEQYADLEKNKEQDKDKENKK
jgi:hypothetical protein